MDCSVCKIQYAGSKLQAEVNQTAIHDSRQVGAEKPPLFHYSFIHFLHLGTWQIHASLSSHGALILMHQGLLLGCMMDPNRSSPSSLCDLGEPGLVLQGFVWALHA